MAELCLICLNSSICLINVTETKSSNLNLISKLKTCVPDVDWKNDFQICPDCTTHLEIAYNFRDLCIGLKNARYEIWGKIEKLKQENSGILESETITVGENKFRCFHCQRNFSNKTFLAKHIEDEHIKFKDLTSHKNCANFPIEYNDSCSINHEQDGKYLINTDVLKLVESKTDESKSIEQKNECDICGTSFNNKYLLKRHKKNVHATEKSFKCDICPSSFVSPVYLKAHQKYHSGERKHVCPFCGKRYITASDLYHHEKIHANKRAYGCTECSKAFNTSSDLHKHKICVHMDRNLWKYCCDYCNKRFPLKTNLDTHIKTHTGEKNFLCHLCDKKCISRSALTRHIDSHSNIQSFKCTICNSGYKYQKSLLIHMLKNHGIGDIKLPERVKKYFCHVCPRSYYVNSKLQKHLRTHTGDKPFKCPNCDKCFIDKSYVKQHMKIAHNSES
ncbi:hypothetical protein WA026_011123 [Henosepilachna vigintioctopunctata]|uniref:C2H2-type domain-containing protein n=1 Tax=Henosepilachna vigintioctopunctata TaxID=420089 RepID=A0AAW1U5R8_9CUCU